MAHIALLDIRHFTLRKLHFENIRLCFPIRSNHKQVVWECSRVSSFAALITFLSGGPNKSRNKTMIPASFSLSPEMPLNGRGMNLSFRAMFWPHPYLFVFPGASDGHIPPQALSALSRHRYCNIEDVRSKGGKEDGKE
jgi:hypothetical protein